MKKFRELTDEEIGIYKYPNKDEMKIIKDFVSWSELNVKRYCFSEGNCYSEKLWLGGISDGAYESKDGHYGVIDFKSSKEAYLSQYLQCALYDIQLSENGVFDSEGNNILSAVPKIDHYVVFPFGMTKVAAQYRWDVEQLREGARSATILYKLDNNNVFGGQK